jgi:hypothetical protein
MTRDPVTPEPVGKPFRARDRDSESMTSGEAAQRGDVGWWRLGQGKDSRQIVGFETGT